MRPRATAPELEGHRQPPPPPLADSPPPSPDSPFSLPCSAEAAHYIIALLHCGAAWVVKTPTPVPFFNPVSSVPQASIPSAWIIINQRDCSQHRLMMRAGGSRPVVVWDVRWGGRVRSGTDICRGQRRLDSRPSKSDSLCMFICSCFRLAVEMLYFCLNLQHSFEYGKYNFYKPPFFFNGISRETQRGICPSVLFLAAIGSFSMSNY